MRMMKIEEAVVLAILLEHVEANPDDTKGLSDAEIQKLVGQSPVLEAIDELHSINFIKLGKDSRGGSLERMWLPAEGAEQQLRSQIPLVQEAFENRLSLVVVKREAERLSELKDAMVAMKMWDLRRPGVNGPGIIPKRKDNPTPTAPPAKPKKEARDEPEKEADKEPDPGAGAKPKKRTPSAGMKAS